MVYKAYKSYCLACPAGFDAPGQTVDAPFSPLVLLRPDAPLTSRCVMPVSDLGELRQTGAEALTPAPEETGALAEFVRKQGAIVLNPSFPLCWEVLDHFSAAPRHGLRVTLLGLGDVGATVLMGLKLLGYELDEIRIFDLNEAACHRYEMEMNQILSPDDHGLPKVTVCQEEELFDCDLFLFTASRGVPALGTQGDVRMLQFEANRKLLTLYARKARRARFRGLFCQISDPVDHLSRVVFLESNKDENGKLDFLGLAPEQIQGFGLGVMAARAKYAAQEMGLSTDTIRVYGPHGAGLVCANAPAEGYDEALSQAITEATRTMNLRIRELGFKPYIAPGISSAAVSILRLLRGAPHYGAIPLDGVYFGCHSRMTPAGPEVVREPVCPQLLGRIQTAFDELRDFSYE